MRPDRKDERNGRQAGDFSGVAGPAFGKQPPNGEHKAAGQPLDRGASGAVVPGQEATPNDLAKGWNPPGY